MKISLDFGGSTTDIVFWSGSQIDNVESFEFNDLGPILEIGEFFERTCIAYHNINEICVTGGRSHNFPDVFNGIPIYKIDEIEAIGRGSQFLSKKTDFLAVSMGTGTCMVHFSDSISKHIGGTGVGGGTFLALVREMLGEDDTEKVKEMFEKGDLSKVDISVGDIIGGDIGMVKADTTASNLGKLARHGEFAKEDLAMGIVNLIGQVIGSNACFAARAYDCNTLVLGGKLTRIKQITEVLLKVADLYDIEVIIPERSEYLSGIGAGC